MAATTDELRSFTRFVPLAEAVLEHDRPVEASTILRRVITVFEQRQAEDPEQAAAVLPRAKQRLERAQKALETEKNAGQ